MSATYRGPADRLIFLQNAIRNIDDLELKGKTNPYCSVNGYMIVHLSVEGTLGIRLGESDRQNLIETHNTKLYEQHGRVMKAFVQVPDTIQSDAEQLKELINIAKDFAMTLKKK